jgi:transcription elongation GreA/GreB family factor
MFILVVKDSEKIISLLETRLTKTVIISREKYSENKISSNTTVKKKKNNNAKSSPAII